MVGKEISHEPLSPDCSPSCNYFSPPLPCVERRKVSMVRKNVQQRVLGHSLCKQGLLKTLEALIALFITLTVLIVFIPRDSVTEQTNEPVGFLPILRENDAFRSCIVAKNITCINQTLDDNLEDNFYFVFNLSESASANVGGLPDVQIFSESLFITGNATNSTNTILRVFYWNK